MRRYMKKRGFTDRLYLTNFVITWVFVALCYIATLFSGILGITDLSALDSAITCSFSQLALHTGFVVWKAKMENIAKNKKIDKETIEWIS